MMRSTVWPGLILLAFAVSGCGEDSATQTGGSHYDPSKDGSAADSSMTPDAEAGPAEDAAVEDVVQDTVTVDEGVDTGTSCVTCSPADIPFDADAGGFGQITILLDEAQRTCQSFSGYHDPDTIVIDDMGSAELSGSFGMDWTPSNATAGELVDGGGFWMWNTIPRSTSVAVTVTHTDGTSAVVTFAVNEPAFSSVTIADICFQ
jgi:hypothetical protein